MPDGMALLYYDERDVLRQMSSNDGTDFGATAVPATFNTADVIDSQAFDTVPSGYDLEITCNGDGSISATLTPTGFITVVVGVGSTVNVLKNVKTTVCVKKAAPGGCG